MGGEVSDQRGAGISWTDQTWNPIRGCTRVSEGCRHCYAETMAARFCGPGQPYEGLARMTPSGSRWTGNVRFVEEHLCGPLRWRRPRKVFVNSMSDLFHASVADYQLDQLFAVMSLAPQHTFQVLTKRPERMVKYLMGDCVRSRIVAHQWGIVEDRVDPTDRRSDDIRATAYDVDGDDWPLPNVWLGVSCEDQANADERIPLLLQTPAAVRWVSAEPLLSSLDLGRWLTKKFQVDYDEMMARFPVQPTYMPAHLRRPPDGLDWVVVGGESGPGARPMHPAWARSLRDQCQSTGVPFFFKQWGEFGPSTQDGFVVRMGKKAAGDRLDGRQLHEFPGAEPRPAEKRTSL